MRPELIAFIAALGLTSCFQDVEPEATGSSSSSSSDGVSSGTRMTSTAATGDGSASGSASTVAADSSGAGTNANQAPSITSLTPGIALVEGGSIAVVAQVMDPDGLEGLGGVLYNADESVTLGVFESGGGGTFSVDVLWDEAVPVDFQFEGTGEIEVVAVFTDAEAGSASATATLPLECGGRLQSPAVCGGRACTDLVGDDENCLACENACGQQGLGPNAVGGCSPEGCAPLWSGECIGAGGPADCAAYCALRGELCSDSCGPLGNRGNVPYSGLDDCQAFNAAGDNTPSCGDAFNFSGVLTHYRCCCESMP